MNFPTPSGIDNRLGGRLRRYPRTVNADNRVGVLLGRRVHVTHLRHRLFRRGAIRQPLEQKASVYLERRPSEARLFSLTSINHFTVQPDLDFTSNRFLEGCFSDCRPAPAAPDEPTLPRAQKNPEALIQKMKKTASTEAAECSLDRGHDAKRDILVRYLRRSANLI